MDKVDDIDRYISEIRDRVSHRMTLQENEQESPKHSTPKERYRDLSDSGIIQTKRMGVSIGDERIDSLRRPVSANAPTNQGSFITNDNGSKGARPKEPRSAQRYAPMCTDNEQGNIDVSPILKNKYEETPRQKKATSKTTRSVTRRETKLANYDGKSDWNDFKSHFDACAIINNWDDEDRGLYLAAALRGPAQAVFSDLPPENRMEFYTLVQALEDRFSPANQTELYRVQLKERHQRAGETLPELGQSIRRLVNQAYPRAPTEVRETLAKDHFLDALHDSELRIKIKQSRPDNLNQTICLAVELEAYYKAEKKQDTRYHARAAHMNDQCTPLDITDKMDALLKQMDTMRKELDEYKKESDQKTPDHIKDWKNKQRCFGCGKLGHIRKDCRQRRQQEGEENSGNDGASKIRNVHFPRKKRRSNKRKIRLRNTAPEMEAGAYIDVIINEKNAKFLVDTGATITLVSHRLFYNLDLDKRPELNVVHHAITSANGTDMTVAGKGKFEFKIGTDNYTAEAVIADLTIDGIIGLDFMKKNNCLINIGEGTMYCNKQEVPLQFTGKLGCYRVAVTEDINIPAGSEIISKGQLVDFQTKDNGVAIGMIEPCEKFIEKEKALVAHTLVKSEAMVPIRLMNVAENAKIIRSGTIIGQFSPVEDIMTDATHTHSTKKNPELDYELRKLVDKASVNLQPKQKEVFEHLLNDYKDIFAVSDKDLGRTSIVRHKINTGSNLPVKQPPRRAPISMREEIDKQIDDMLERGVIEPADGPWSSGIVMVRKKDGTTRFCVDYRKVNDLTIKDAYPLPRIDDSLEQLSGNQWFTTLDLCSGYWQVEVEPEDRPKTAFATRRGLFQFRQMPFGLACAPATFERLMDRVLAGLQWSICLVYLDDIIVVARSFEEMVERLRIVFSRLQNAGLKLKPKKCTMFAKEVHYLGHVVSEHGVATDPDKIKSVQDWPVPKDQSELRSFLGLCGYYRRYIERFAATAKCLHTLTEKGRKYLWTDECQQAFETLKIKLTNAPILAHPDFSKPFILDTDASNNAIGAILSQNIDGFEKVIAFGSRTLSKSERKYCVTRKELLAVVHFVKHFRHFLYGRTFIVRTDHSSLQWLLNFKNAEGQLARWLEVLSTYDMKIKHRPGSQHCNADAMSRIPCKQCGYSSDWRTKESVNTLTPCMTADKSEQDDDYKSLQQLQENDTSLHIVIDWVTKGQKPSYKEVGEYNYVIKTLWSQFDNLRIKDGILWKVHGFNNKFRAVVPMSERRQILKQCHDNKASGHLGIKKTLGRVKERFYWPGLRSDVDAYVVGCDACARRKGPNKRQRAPMEVQKSGFPMERIALDILGELPLTKDGHKYILVVSDYYTKWTESFPMRNMETTTIADILVKEIVTRFGVPSFLHSDQGSQFESSVFQEICSLLQIEKTRTTPYHPQSDGMVERFNGTLAKMLTAYVDEHHTNWDTFLPYVMMAYRSAIHETTGCTPNRLMLGREVATPIDLMYELPRSDKVTPQNTWVWEVQGAMEEAHHLVRKHMDREMARQKKSHDKTLNWHKFKENENVYVFFPIRKGGCSPKFTCYWRGPFRVLKRYSDVNYLVNCGRRGRAQVIHVERMRPCKSQCLRGETDCTNTDATSEQEPQAEAKSDYDNEILDGEIEAQNPLILDDESHTGRPQRHRQQPKWLHDFVRY